MKSPHRPSSPPLSVMHLGFLFTGAATLLLGPILPLFAHLWGLSDAHSGALIAAQFLGLFTGSITLFRNLRRSLLSGHVCAMVGFLLLAALLGRSSAFPTAVCALYLIGFGLGQINAAVNLLSAGRYTDPQRRSSALSLLNFTWSAGAFLSPLMAAVFIARASLHSLLVTFAAAAASLWVAVILLVPAPPSAPRAQDVSVPQRAQLPFRGLVFFVAMFFLYGGLEATTSGWLSTYTLRYTTLDPAQAALATTALWAAFAVGRAVASVVLLYVPEQAVRLAGLALSAFAVALLRATHNGASIAFCAAALGLGMAPFFPVTFSRLVALSPTPRQAGAAISNIGLGSAVLPYLVGVVSTRTHSLRLAMAVPIFLAVALLLLSVSSSGKPALLPETSR
jgi:FHS family glucose/mannose:H+ symporter-like MFS transporter